MRVRREWLRSSWTVPNGTERSSLNVVHGQIGEWLESAGDAATVTISTDELRRAHRASDAGPGSNGAEIKDRDRGVTYRVTLDTTDPSEVRLGSVTVVRDRIPAGPKRWTAKRGTWRPKGKVGAYVAPYDEGVFRVPVRELIAQALALTATEDAMRARGGGRGIVIGASKPAPPTPQELRQHLHDKMTRREIAERYQRETRMVYNWLEAARKAAPELNWPDANPGPKKAGDQ
jgi:hypothetical protein